MGFGAGSRGGAADSGRRDESLAVRTLGLFCHAPRPVPMVHYKAGSELKNLRDVFPDIAEQVRGKRVVDFGCGAGYQAVALAQAGAAQVVGVEIVPHLIAQAAERAAAAGDGKVQITSNLSGITADLIVVQNSFEHFVEPEAILARLKAALAPGGRVYVTFGPPWFAPTGSHMGFFCRLPWVNLMFSEQTVMTVRRRYRDDGASDYREAGLAQMSLAKFERVVRGCGMRLVWRRYDCLKRMTALQHLPVARELFVNRVNCILQA